MMMRQVKTLDLLSCVMHLGVRIPALPSWDPDYSSTAVARLQPCQSFAAAGPDNLTYIGLVSSVTISVYSFEITELQEAALTLFCNQRRIPVCWVRISSPFGGR